MSLEKVESPKKLAASSMTEYAEYRLWYLARPREVISLFEDRLFPFSDFPFGDTSLQAVRDVDRNFPRKN